MAVSDIVTGVEWKRIYWVKGDTPRGRQQNAIKDPPCAGWQHAIVLRGEKRSTIFCPYTMEAFTVPNGCGELAKAKDPAEAIDPMSLANRIQDRWKEYQGYGWSKDYDTAALVLRKLGAEVPAQLLKGGEEDTRKRGGKEVEASLKKPVKRNGKRGKFLEWFLAGEGSRSVREAMAEFGMSRSNALSYLYMLQKDHGIGYTLVGDIATIALPDGCKNPFEDGQTTAVPAKGSLPDDDEDFLGDPDEGKDDDKDLEDEDEEDDDWLG